MRTLKRQTISCFVFQTDRAEQCTNCTEKNFCDKMGLEFPKTCIKGHYCPPNSIKPTACPPVSILWLCTDFETVYPIKFVEHISLRIESIGLGFMTCSTYSSDNKLSCCTA